MKVLFGNRKLTTQGGDYTKMIKFRDSVLDVDDDMIVEVINPNSHIHPAEWDLIHSFNLNWNWTYYFYTLAKRFSLPLYVSTIHFSVVKQLTDKQQKEIMDYATGIVMFSELERKEIEDRLSIEIPEEKVNYLRNGVSDCFKDTQDWKSRKYDVIVVTNYLEERKNVHEVIETCKKLNKKALIIGGVRDDEYSSLFIHPLIPSKGIVFADKRYTHSQLNDFYNESKVVVAPGDPDPFPNPVMEGTNAGCNIICRNGGYVDLESEHIEYYDDKEELGDILAKFLIKQFARRRLPSYEVQARKLINIWKK